MDFKDRCRLDVLFWGLELRKASKGKKKRWVTKVVFDTISDILGGK